MSTVFRSALNDKSVKRDLFKSILFLTNYTWRDVIPTNHQLRSLNIFCMAIFIANLNYFKLSMLWYAIGSA